MAQPRQLKQEHLDDLLVFKFTHYRAQRIKEGLDPESQLPLVGRVRLKEALALPARSVFTEPTLLFLSCDSTYLFL